MCPPCCWTTHSSRRRHMTNGAINENQLIFEEVKAYKNGAKYITFNIPRGVAHITFHILFVISDAILAKNIAFYGVFISTSFRYSCIGIPIPGSRIPGSRTIFSIQNPGIGDALIPGFRDYEKRRKCPNFA